MPAAYDAPRQNDIANNPNWDAENNLGRGIGIQQGYQLLAVVTTILMGIFGGALAGFLARLFESPKPFFHDTWNFVEVPKEEDRTVEAEIELPASEFEISVNPDTMPNPPNHKVIIRQQVGGDDNGFNSNNNFM